MCFNIHEVNAVLPISLLVCAEKLCQGVKSEKAFHIKKAEYIKYLNYNKLPGSAAQAYLENFSKIIGNFNKIASKNYFNSTKLLNAAIAMKERIKGERAKAGEIKRPKTMCPICWKYHFNSAEIPEKCWDKAMKGDFTLTYEFNEFLKSNNFGEITQ